jgi:hypothetical protein
LKFEFLFSFLVIFLPKFSKNSKIEFTNAFRQIPVFQNLKFQNSKNDIHEVGLNNNFIQNLCYLALNGEVVGVAQISPYGTGGGGMLQTEFFFALIMFLGIKWCKTLIFAKICKF